MQESTPHIHYSICPCLQTPTTIKCTIKPVLKHRSHQFTSSRMKIHPLRIIPLSTDEARLFKFCLSVTHENEFFISNAIGWALRQLASFPGHFLRGRKKWPGTICSRMRLDPQNLVYFPLVSTVVLRNMSFFVS